MTGPLMDVRDLVIDYPIRGGLLRRVTGQVSAVAGVNLSIDAGETVGLVGESGCGKTSLARSLVGLVRPTAGRILLDGRDIASGGADSRRALHRGVQMVFQDPYASLNPRRTVRQIVTRGWSIHPDLVPAEQRADELARLLRRVGLNPDHADRFPHQFSGGQRQRIGIARALAMRPRLIVCDEAVSALDVSIRAQIINLLQDLQAELGVAYLFIAHDLSIVEHLCHRVAVMYLGKVVESGERSRIFDAPAHPYTRSLLDAVPVTRPWLGAPAGATVSGDPPSPARPPAGCRFHTRCRRAQDVCSRDEPPLERTDGRLAACWFPGPDPAPPETAAGAAGSAGAAEAPEVPEVAEGKSST
jgi:oligopeptide transport system ATP-binding protein